MKLIFVRENRKLMKSVICHLAKFYGKLAEISSLLNQVKETLTTMLHQDKKLRQQADALATTVQTLVEEVTKSNQRAESRISSMETLLRQMQEENAQNSNVDLQPMIDQLNNVIRSERASFVEIPEIELPNDGEETGETGAGAGDQTGESGETGNNASEETSENDAGNSGGNANDNGEQSQSEENKPELPPADQPEQPALNTTGTGETAREDATPVNTVEASAQSQTPRED